jgi:hypothetical protein
MTNTPLQNPWLDLPATPPYVLAEDLAHIQHHRNFSNLRLDTLPDQVIGGLDNAEAVFLLLNPGFDDKDITVNMALPEFVEANRRNLTDPFTSPFYYFSDGLETTGGYIWWAKILKPLLQAGVTENTLRNKVMAIEYFPYHSKTYKNLPIVPSQQFAFDLVREAIRREKSIVVMRSPKLWLEAVPELADYPYMTLNSWLNIIVSPKNLGEVNFDVIRTKLM